MCRFLPLPAPCHVRRTGPGTAVADDWGVSFSAHPTPHRLGRSHLCMSGPAPAGAGPHEPNPCPPESRPSSRGRRGLDELFWIGLLGSDWEWNAKAFGLCNQPHIIVMRPGSCRPLPYSRRQGKTPCQYGCPGYCWLPLKPSRFGLMSSAKAKLPALRPPQSLTASSGFSSRGARLVGGGLLD